MQSTPKAAPYLRAKETSIFMTWKKTAALLPLVLAAVVFYRLPAILLLSTAVASALLAELFCRFLFQAKPALADGNSVLTGLLVAFVVPAGLPLWSVAVGAFFAVALGSEAFGGSGHSPVPAVAAGYLFMLVSFPLAMRHSLAPGSLQPDAMPLVWMKEGALDNLPGWVDMLMGRVSGSLGTVFFPAVLLSAVMLLSQRIIFWEMPFLYLAAVGLTAFGFGEDPFLAMFLGTPFFAAFFIVPDSLTAPHHRHGVRFFSLFAGALTVVFRHTSFAFDPALTAIFLCSFLSSWLDEAGRPEQRKPQVFAGEKA